MLFPNLTTYCLPLPKFQIVMFTINIYLKIAIIIVGLIGGTVLWATMGIWYGIWFVLIGLGMLATYIFLGTVQSAATLMQNQDFDGANKRLALTLNPKWLYATNRAYFYMIKGSIALAFKKCRRRGNVVEKSKKLLMYLPTMKKPCYNFNWLILQLQKANGNRQNSTSEMPNSVKSLNLT